MRACREDAESRTAMLPVLDALRGQGICVLANGAIEDYYPAQAPTSGPKPERALMATNLVPDHVTAAGVSQPLTDGRDPELVEVCRALFDGL
ncbi:MAG: hypothetical protein GY761_04045 [Hyphomicrobiales bacterium]|nr:hypothetical protein [Hyphomicrobiales bacterium]